MLSNNIIYLCGSITGLSREEYLKKFLRAETEWRKLGWRVINPAAVSDRLPILQPEAYYRITLSMLNEADAIYVIDGLKTSRGVRLEVSYAYATGKKVYSEIPKK